MTLHFSTLVPDMCFKTASFLVILLSVVINAYGSPQQVVKGGAVKLSSADKKDVWSSLSSSRRIAVLVGINSFDDENWVDLNFAEKDAQDMAGVLNDHRYGQFDKVITLTSPEQTTRGAIVSNIKNLLKENVSAEDTVIFYISSHGTISRTRDGKLHQYVVTRDTSFKNISETAIDLDDIKTAFNHLASQKKTLIFAFCHSGQGKSQLNNDVTSELLEVKAPFFVKPIKVASEATVILSASAWGETARENRELKNDVYTHFLIEGIKSNDSNGDGAVTVTEAHDYAKEQTYYFTVGEQRPSMESFILGSDPIVLSGEVVRNGKPVIYDYSDRYEDMVITIDGTKKGTLPLGIAVDPGKHTIELAYQDGDLPIYREHIEINDGERLSLPILIHGYDQGMALRVGYHEFLNDKIENSVAKPMLVYGLSYYNYRFFSPRLGFRADIVYGADKQTLTPGTTSTKADVELTDYGVALLYRYMSGGTAIYAGPRVGQLTVSRDIALSSMGKRTDNSLTVGGVVGIYYKYKQQVTFSLESAISNAVLQINGQNITANYFNLFGNLNYSF